MKKVKFVCVGDVVKLSLDDFNWLIKKANAPKKEAIPAVKAKVKRPRKPKAEKMVFGGDNPLPKKDIFKSEPSKG